MGAASIIRGVSGDTHTNLGPEADAFVGRASDQAALGQLVAEGKRLVTLLGPGGIGKTRLARHFAAAQAAEGLPAWFVDLSRVSSDDADEVASATAEVLGLRVAAGADMVLAVARGLAQRGPLLLVCDNVEQAVAAAARSLSRWLELAPETILLVTSRERLRIAGEVAYELRPLSLPGEAEAESEAVALFVERVGAVRPGYAPGEEDRAAIAAIVELLDGIPLAIELAAGRCGMMGPAQLLARLPGRLKSLGGAGRRDASGRQATLWSTIDWSWDLLDDAERAALAQCSVFRGGFALEAAEAVLDVPGGGWVGDQVQALRDKSLVRAWPLEQPELAGELRLGLYESIREYAAERLVEMGAGEVRERHRAHYLELGQALAAKVDGHGGPEALARLALERENLLAVVRRALEEGEGEAAMAGLVSLDTVLATRGPFRVHEDLLDRALAQVDVDGTWLARGLEARGRLRRTRGRLPEAVSDLDEAIRVAQEAGARKAEAEAVAQLGIARHEQGDLTAAKALHERALELFRGLSERGGEGRALGSLAILHSDEGRSDDAQIHYEWALSLLRRVGDRRSEAVFLNALGDLHHEQRRSEEARAHYERALAAIREVGDRRVEGVILGNIGATHHEAGRFEEARECREDAARRLAQVGDRRLEGVFLGYLAAARLEEAAQAEAPETSAVVAGYRRALDRLEEAGDRRHLGLFQAHLASAFALGGQREVARHSLEAARGQLGELGDELLLEALALHEALVAGEREAAAARAQAAQEAAESSDEVRFALRLLRPLVGDAAAAEPSAEVPTLAVAKDGRRICPPGGEPIDLSRRRAMRLIVAALADKRESEPGKGMSLDDILEAGWPGERVIPEAGANRVYVALATLRKMGLREVLLSRDDGYLFDPGVPLSRLEVT